MPVNQKLPSSFRYIKARLRVLKRPMVWGSVAVLVVGILSVSEYLAHPERLGQRRETDGSGTASLDTLPDRDRLGNLPSQEDSAIGVDIDNLPLLLNDLDTNAEGRSPSQLDNRTPPTLDFSAPLQLPGLNPEEQGAARGGASGESRLNLNGGDLNGGNLLANGSATPELLGSGSSRPGILNQSAASPFQFGTSSDSSLANSPVGTDLFGISTAPASGSASTANPLASALDRRSSSPASGNSSDETQATEDGSASQEQNANSNNSEGAIAPSRLGQATVIPRGLLPYVPQTSPPAGTTGYIVPPSLRVPNSAFSGTGYPAGTYTNPYIQPVPTVSAPQVLPPTVPTQPFAPGYQSPYGLNQGGFPNTAYPANPYPQPQITQPQPYQLPQEQPEQYRRPGLERPIGGGEINTFSNP